MQKLLIADNSILFTSSLEAAFQGEFIVMTCRDGEQALDLLPRFRPDVLILNLMLPRLDGLSVLQRTPFHPHIILATTTYLSGYVEQRIADLGIDFTMISPMPGAVEARLRDLLRHDAHRPDSTDPQVIAAHHLQRLGIPSHLRGYRALCIAIPIFAGNPTIQLTKNLYPKVAKLCGCPDGRAVEHAIRKAIEAAWEKRDNAIWRKYFTFGPKGKIACPSSKAFLSRLAELMGEL